MSESPQVPVVDEPSSVRLIITLGVAGLFAGLALVGIYELTEPRIAANKARALREAVLEVVPGSASLEELSWRDGALVASEGAAEPIYAAYDEAGDLSGYAIPGEGPGFQDTIKLIYGFQPESRTIVGMYVLESKETPGLGDKIFKDDEFRGSFRALAVDPEIVPTKKGTASAPHEVDCITGATISSKAVVRILNESNQTWLGRLPAPGEEPPPTPAGGG